MDLTLAQLGFLILILSGSARLLLLSVPLIKFIHIFERKVVEGSRLLASLEIPGLRKFVRDEVILGMTPYIALYGAIRFFDLDSHLVLSHSTFLLVILGISLLVWLILDWWRSFSIYEKLSRLHKETKQVRSIAGNTLDGLRFIVHVRGTVRKTVANLGYRAALGAVRGKLRRTEEENGKTRVRTVARGFVEGLIGLPERVTGRLSEWAKEDLDGKLQKKFQKYANRSVIKLTILFVWGLFPSIILSSTSVL